MTPAQARTRRRAAGLALSLAVHGALLLAFMSVTPRLVAVPRLPAPPEPVVKLDLRPAARSQAAASAAAPASPRRASAMAAPAASAPLAVIPRPVIRPALPASPAPAASGAATPAAAGSTAATAAAPSGGDDGRWRVHGEGGDAAAAARALVRGTIGCGAAGYLHLTADERDHCNAEFVKGMRTLQPDAIPAEKRAYYDAVVAAYAKMHAPTPMAHAVLGDNLGLANRWEAPEGAHGPGLGCKISFGKPRGWKTYANRKVPPHWFKFGPLPCYVSPPSGLNTEEADVPPPASLREREDDAAHAARLDKPPG